jgi:hypothetical protein
MLKHFLFNNPNSGVDESNWKPREGDQRNGNLIKFDQREFVEDSPNSSVLDLGQVYIPDSCSKNT